MGAEGRDIHAKETDKRRDAAEFDGPESEAVFRKVGLDPIGKRITLRARQRAGEVLHDGGVRVERRERRAILRAPRAKP